MEQQLDNIHSSFQREFGITQIIKESWKNVKGVKGSYWAAIGLYWLINFGISVVLSIFFEIANHLAAGFSAGHQVLHLLERILHLAMFAFLLLPMMAGIVLIGIRRAIDKPVSYQFIFKFFQKKYYIRLFLAWAAVTLILFIGLLAIAFLVTMADFSTLSNLVKLLIWLSIAIIAAVVVYFIIVYSLVFPFIIDSNLSTWRALEASRKAITSKIFRILGLFTIVFLINILSAILFFIGLIWTIPFTYNVIGTIYRDLAGVKGKDPVTLQEES